MGKAGKLLGTVAFMAAGSLIGGGVGASVGSLLGGLLFGEKPAAPSIGDLKASVASASFLPIMCGGDVPDPSNPGQSAPGGAWLPGKVISCPPGGGVTRVRVAASTGAGTHGRVFGGMSGDEDERYLSLAVAWCEGSEAYPVDLLELKAEDEILIRHDAAANEDGYVARTPAYNAGRLYGWHSDNFRHYFGTDAQLPDDVVSTWWEGGQAPAFRRTSYTVILNLPIKKFGRIPAFYARLSNGVILRIDACRFFLQRANGLDGEKIIPDDAISLSKISGTSRAWFMTQPGAPREMAEAIAARSFCALVEDSYQIRDIDLANPTVHTLENWELGAQSDGGDGGERPARFKRGLEEAVKLPSRVEVRYVDARKRDENVVLAVMPTATHENVLTFDLATVDLEEEVAAWAQVMLDAAWVGRTPGEVTVLPRRLDVTAGDVILVPAHEDAAPGSGATALLVRERLFGGGLTLRGVGWNKGTYSEIPRIIPTPRPVAASIWGEPLLFVANTVAFIAGMLDQPGIIVAGSQRPSFRWGEALALNFDTLEGGVWDEEYDDNWRTGRAVMGETRAVWTPPAPGEDPVYDSDNLLPVEMIFGELATTTEAKARDGANQILFENGLIFSFTTATQTGLTVQGTGFYDLDGFIAGRWGSDGCISGAVPAGTRFVLLYNENRSVSGGWKFQGLRANFFDQHARLRAPFLERPQPEGIREFDYDGTNRRPVAPLVTATRLPDGGLRLVGRARPRGSDNAAAPLSELRLAAGFTYKIAFAASNETRVVNNDNGAFDWQWSGTQLAAILGVTSEEVAESDAAGTVALQGPSYLRPGLSASWQAEGAIAV